MPIRTQDFDQLMNQAKVTLVGSSDAGLKGAFYDVLSEFFNDSSCWTDTVTINAISTRTEYPLQVNEGQILRLRGVWNSDYSVGISALMPVVGTLLLSAAPNSAETYYAEVVCNTALPSDRNQVPLAPDWVLPIWHVGLLDGLLGKMMLQPNKSYANLQQGTYHLKRFRDAISRARVSKLRANTVGSQAWRFPQSFRSNTQQGGVPGGSGGTDRSF